MRRAMFPLLLSVALVACDGGPSRTPDDARTTTAAADTEADDEGGTEGDSEASAEVDCDLDPVVTYETFGRGFLATYCNGCHGGQVHDRKGAPDLVVFDDAEQVSTFAERIYARVALAQGPAPMPPAGGVTPEDLARLRIWLSCYP